MVPLEDLSNGLSRKEIGRRIEKAIDEAPGRYRGNKQMVAAEIGRDKDTIQGYIDGKHEPGFLTMWKIAQVTGKPLGWFAEEDVLDEVEKHLEQSLRRMLRQHKEQLIRQINDIDAALGKQ